MDPLDIHTCQGTHNKKKKKNLNFLLFSIISITDMDECSLSLHSCDLNADCTNTLGSFSCACRAGYEGNGQSCQGL